MTAREEIAQRISDDGIEYILAQFVDIHGSAKVKMCPAGILDHLADVGVGFGGGAVWGMGQGPHSHDMMSRIDMDSYTPLPWDRRVARFASDLYVDDQPHPHCSRVNLKRVLAQARAEGYLFNVGVEPEHFLVVRQPDGSIAIWDPDGIEGLEKAAYDFKGLAGAMGYLQEMMDGLNGLGWEVYQSDHEDANGQYEINFVYTDALTTADRYTFFKMMTSQVARKYGAIATHMPKPFSDRTGSGAHIHYHIADSDTGKNLFLDERDPRGLGLSTMAYHFIGGIFDHAQALCGVTSPTVNCYKRLQVGSALHGSRSGFLWTPACITYGDNNRTQMVRTAGPGHFEDRTISAGCNLYLALAAYLSAGLDGIRRRLDPGEPNLTNMYDVGLEEIRRRGIRLLPYSLSDALDHLEEDSVVLDGLGPIGPEFLRLKRSEWDQYHRQVGQWETDRYLTLF